MLQKVSNQQPIKGNNSNSPVIVAIEEHLANKPKCCCKEEEYVEFPTVNKLYNHLMWYVYFTH